MKNLDREVINRSIHRLNKHVEIIVTDDDGYSIAVLSSDGGSIDPENDEELIFVETDSSVYMFNDADEHEDRLS